MIDILGRLAVRHRHLLLLVFAALLSACGGGSSTPAPDYISTGAAPTSNFQPADQVLGQSTFAGQIANDDNQDSVKDATPSARTLYQPWGVGVYRNKLLVSDFGNSRVLVFDSK